MKHGGFGWPVTAGEKQPHGHYSRDGYRVHGADGYEIGAYMAPAGDIHCSIAELCEYGRAHLKGIQGKDGWLKASTVAALHQPPDAGAEGYACGWMVTSLDKRGAVHEHNGSGGTFFSRLAIYPKQDLVVALVVNCGGMHNDSLLRQMAKAIRARYE